MLRKENAEPGLTRCGSDDGTDYALRVRVALKTRWAGTHGPVVDDGALSPVAACSRAGVDALLADACESAGAVGAEHALGSAADLGVAEVALTALAHVAVAVLAAVAIGAAGVGHAGVRRWRGRLGELHDGRQGALRLHRRRDNRRILDGRGGAGDRRLGRNGCDGRDGRPHHGRRRGLTDR